MMHRRDVLQLAVAAGLIPASALAQAQTAPAAPAADWNKTAFETKTVNDAARALGPGAAPAESRDIQLTAPDIAENGNVVRIGAATTIPGASLVAFLVEKNPNALAAVFNVPEGTDANFSTNVKMGQSSNVIALVKAGDRYFFASKEVKVTLGGCGG